MRARALRRRAQGNSGASTACGGSHLIALAVILIAGGAIVPAGADALFVKVTATPIDFGPIYAGETFTGMGTIIVTAPGGLNFRVALDRGFHFFGGARHLKRNIGAEVIPYSLYSDSGCTLALGDAGFGDTFPAGSSVAGTGIGRDQLITIYARLTVPAAAPPGHYLDSIMVSVIY
jgi:spore coat protein U-like protein